MSSVQNEEVLAQVIEQGFNRGNFAALDALFVPEYVEHQFGLQKTLEGFKQDIQYLRNAFPDLHMTIEDLISDDDKVWIRMTATGTNLGQYIGPATGKPMSITVIDVCRFENGKIVEHWGVPDRLAALIQLGLIPQGQ